MAEKTLKDILQTAMLVADYGKALANSSVGVNLPMREAAAILIALQLATDLLAGKDMTTVLKWLEELPKEVLLRDIHDGEKRLLNGVVSTGDKAIERVSKNRSLN